MRRDLQKPDALGTDESPTDGVLTVRTQTHGLPRRIEIGDEATRRFTDATKCRAGLSCGLRHQWIVSPCTDTTALACLSMLSLA